MITLNEPQQKVADTLVLVVYSTLKLLPRKSGKTTIWEFVKSEIDKSDCH